MNDFGHRLPTKKVPWLQEDCAMVRWFPRCAGILFFLLPIGCMQFRENWCMEHGFVPANQAQQQTPPPQVYAPQSYANPNYAAAPYCPPAPNYCPPPGVGGGAPATWSQGR